MISRKWQIALQTFLISTSVILLLLIFTDAIPWLRGPAPETSEWFWPYELRPLDRFWPSLISAVLLFLIAVWWLYPDQTNKKRDVLALVTLIPTIFSLQVALVYADRPDYSAELIDRTLSNLSSGYFEPAAEIDSLDHALRQYPQLMPDFVSEHARTHPPGLISANWLSIKLFAKFPMFSEQIARYIRPLRCADLWMLSKPPEIAAALGFWAWLPLFVAALTILPAYGLARSLLSNKQTRLATMLVGTIPALILFAPKPVQLYPFIILLAFWIFHAGLQKRSYLLLLLAGVLISILSFLSLGNASIILLFLGYAFLNIYQPRSLEKTNTISQAIAYLWKPLLVWSLGTISVWILYWIIYTVPPWAIAQIGLEQHYQLVTNDRRYEWWVFWNIIDLIIYSGWPLILGFGGSLFFLFRKWRRRELDTIDYLAVSLLLLLLIINFSGSSRGEVGRLWLFFMPLLALPSARFWGEISPGKWVAPTIIFIQLAFIIALGFAWKPVRAVIVVAEQPAMSDESLENPINAKYVEEPISLVGYSISPKTISAGESINLTLFWQADSPASKPYTVFNHVIDPAGTLVSQKDNWPVDGQWPPSCWQSGEIIVDSHEIQLPETLPPGTYQLITGLYDSNNGKRLTLENGQDQIHIQDLIIQSE